MAAFSSGGGASRVRAKDQAMAANLGPSPASWNPKPTAFPYHMSMGRIRIRPDGKAKRKGTQIFHSRAEL
jgi:hypothetical protein